ncbi:recombinase RecT [Nitrosomonas mobilis]|uniref:RecT protein n=1 Tax=Nitrosomonas mobilis TaxID=51642 RepID=A0A1G5SCS8_9PROT|nr:recombinase RecT [Nitrosomonas mobilis]SCZ85004.1 RecT protein [Nitrosomonas mobilis]
MAFQTLKNINRSQSGNNENEPKNFPVMLDKFKAEIARALPRHINPDRMTRIALTAFRMNPRLAECDPRSVFAAIVQSSQLGLEVGLMGEAHLVPFKNECQLIPGYTGLIKLARQSGFVQDIYAHEVRMNDQFNLNLGLERSLEHVPMQGSCGFPATDDERGPIAGFYAVGVFKDGSRTFVAMGVTEVERIRDNSRGYQAAKRSKKDSVWDSDFTAMGLKTAIRRLCKYLPKSPELATALSLDAAFEQGKDQHLNLIDAATGEFVPDNFDEEESSEVKVEMPPAVKKSDAAKASEAEISNPVLQAAILALEKAKTYDQLDEIYIRLEADFADTDLEFLMRHYRRIRDSIESK